REIPVHQLVQERADVVGATILEVQIVRVLPNVNGQKWLLAVRKRSVRVSSFFDGQLLAVQYQPGPAASELCCSGGLERLGELTKVSKTIFDAIHQLSGGLSATTWLH